MDLHIFFPCHPYIILSYSIHDKLSYCCIPHANFLTFVLGNISCSSGHCSNEASDDAPAILECSEYHLCDAIAGDTLEIPCGGIEEASFTYRIISNLFAIESEITLNQFLIMNVTASDNEKHVMCLPNNTQDHYCYKLQIECKFIAKCCMHDCIHACKYS